MAAIVMIVGLWMHCIFRVSFIMTASVEAMDTVILNSSIGSRNAICPDETVFYECSVAGDRLVWTIPTTQGLQYQQYFAHSIINNVKNIGAATVWLSNSEPLTSWLVFPYSPQLNNSIVTCSKTRHEYEQKVYIIADVPEKPMLCDPILIGQSENSVQFLLEWSQTEFVSDLDHYEISISGNRSVMFVSAHENKTVISVVNDIAINVSIVAVSRCGKLSQLDEKPIPIVEKPTMSCDLTTSVNTVTVVNPTQCSHVNSKIVITAVTFITFAILFGLTVIVVITLACVWWRKHRRNLMHVMSGPQTETDEEGRNKEAEGFPLLNHYANNED